MCRVVFAVPPCAGQRAVAQILVRASSEIDSANHAGETALHAACRRAMIRHDTMPITCAHQLLTRPLIRSPTHSLGVFYRYGHERIVRLLLNVGASCNSRSISGDTPALIALANNDTLILSILHEAAS